MSSIEIRPRAHPHDQEDVEYDLVELRQLPVVDVSKSIKRVLLSKRVLCLYKRLNKRLKHANILLYFSAFPIGAAVLTVAAAPARTMALFKFSLQVPMLLFVTAGLRTDILWCLATTYDFWFFSITNALTATFLAVHLGDQRAFLVPVYWWGIQLCVCADAKVNDPRVAGGAALAALYHVFLLFVFGLHLTPDAHAVDLFRKNDRLMTSNDFLLNSFSTMMALMARTAYRQRIYFRLRGRELTHSRMSSYPCRVKLSVTTTCTSTGPSSLLADEARPQSSGAASGLEGTPASTKNISRQHLLFVKPKQTYRARDVVCPTLFAFVASRPNARVKTLVRVLGGLGFVLNVAAFAGSHAWSKSTFRSGPSLALSLAGLACTLCFCATLVGLSQRQLLWRLVTSFDFIFIAMQNTLAYIAVSDMFSWGPRCLPVLTGWLWLMWLLTLDALTPAARSMIGFRARAAISVLLFAIFVQCYTLHQILIADAAEIQDRVFWRATFFGHTMELRAVPFFLARVSTLLLWSLRVLFRMCTSSDDSALIMIQGVVQFVADPETLRRRTSSLRLHVAVSTMLRQMSSAPAIHGGIARIHPNST